MIGPDLRRRLGVVGALSLVMIMVTSPVASAVDHPLQLSLDQERWSTTVQSPLVASRTWVPGDSAAVTVWTRNTTPEPARLSVDLIRDGGVPVDVSEIVVTATVTDRTVTLDRSGSLVVPVSAGAVTPVTVAVVLPSDAGNDTQDQRTTFDLRLALDGQISDAEDPPPAPLPPAGVEPASATLPSTGAPPVLTVLVAALVLLTGGMVSIRRRSSAPLPPPSKEKSR